MKLHLAILVTIALAISTNAASPKIALKNLLFNPHSALRVEQPTVASDSVKPSAVVLNQIEQRVDNFDTSNHATFQQRYLMNGEFFQPGGPVIIFLSGEWEISEPRLEDSMMVDLARATQGYVFYLEHRYYGLSFPTEDVSDANLRWLTPDQALADTAHFVTHIKSTHVTPGAEDSRVIVIGAHYSGNLAAWFRQLYPHLADAAWASSAPVLAVINHFEYKEVAAAAYRAFGGEECIDTLEAGFADMEAMVVEDRLDELYAIFSLCAPLEDELDISTFFAIMAEFYSILPQFGQIISVANVCQIITEGSAPSPAHRIARILQEYMEEDCIPSSYEAAIEFDRETGLTDPAVAYGVRQASYQTCTQFGWHHTSDSEYQPFGSRFPIEFYDQACEDVFGDLSDNVQFNSERINLLYGGLTPEVTRVIYTQGMSDPWRTIGVQEDLNPLAPAIVIEGAGQSQDLFAISPADSPALANAKRRIMDTLIGWLYLFPGRK